MRSHAFRIVLAGGEVTNDDCDALYEAGCDDGTVVTREGVTHIAFDREAESLEEAVTSAVAELLKAGYVVDRAEVDDSEGDEKSTHVLWRAEELCQETLGEYLPHLVALSGCYHQIDSSGEATGHASAFHYSGFVLEVEGQWYWITAAHVFDDKHHGLDTLRRSGRIHIDNCVLNDSFAGDIKGWKPIPFAYWEYDRIGCYEKAHEIDLCAFKLGDGLRKLLDANGVIALSKLRWEPQDLSRFDAFILLGLPSELEQTNVTPENGGYRVRSKPTPAAVYVERVADISAECLTPEPRFVGRVGREAGDVRGMSGGPILAKSLGDAKHYLVAVQSSWLKRRGLIFGSPADTLVSAILKASRS